jgi:glycosyltransferase involved in cell wall biosynthesis
MKGKMWRHETDPANCAVSFIIPAYNEGRELPATLRAIHNAAQRAGCNYEIVVVDDASTDGTGELAREIGARVVSISRRHIAAARNAGARAASYDIFVFVDADTHIAAQHVSSALAAVKSGHAGGGARIVVGGKVPPWAKVLLNLFTFLYFGMNFGAGAFLFTTRANFSATGGFDEKYFAGEEVHFTLALRKLGRFVLLRRPVITSGRKLRLYSPGKILRQVLGIIVAGPHAVTSRRKLDLWYGGEREPKVG